VETAEETGRILALRQQVKTGNRDGEQLEGSVRKLATQAGTETDALRLPRHLTARARRLLHQGRDLLDRLRGLAADPLLADNQAGPLAIRYRQTVAMADTALRMVQSYPDSASAQIKLCEGLEATLDVLDERLAALVASLAEQRQESFAVEQLARLLGDLAAGRVVDLQSFTLLADALLTDASDAGPVHFYQANPADAVRLIACHGLITAQVVARLGRHDPELRGLVREAVIAALVHDAGMLKLEPEIWLHPRPLTEAERRVVESHTHAGAQLANRLLPGGTWLAEAAANHHERLDGTGYPAGLRELQLSPLVRLLTVCDVYAALCQPRPHRPAIEPRTALTDTLLLAEKGLLDHQAAERLLQMAFYPVGTVVELGDGTLARVVANHPLRGDLMTPARPVVAVLTDAAGQPLPLPRYLDLAQAEGRAIVRTLPPSEGRQVLEQRHLEAA
jgi:hypothetical protein